MAAMQTTVQHNINNEAAGKCVVGIYLRSPLLLLLMFIEGIGFLNASFAVEFMLKKSLG